MGRVIIICVIYKAAFDDSFLFLLWLLVINALHRFGLTMPQCACSSQDDSTSNDFVQTTNYAISLEETVSPTISCTLLSSISPDFLLEQERRHDLCACMDGVHHTRSREVGGEAKIFCLLATHSRVACVRFSRSWKVLFTCSMTVIAFFSSLRTRET